MSIDTSEAQSEVVAISEVVPHARLGTATNFSSGHGANCGTYGVRFAQSAQDLESVFRLRFRVFNLELNEGLESAYQYGQDRDAFDDVCDHLIVEHRPTARVVGTYRLQSGPTASNNIGFYSE